MRAALLLILIGTVWAQDPLDIFPTRVGNVWEYSTDAYGLLHREIIRDSAAAEGTYYFVNETYSFEDSTFEDRNRPFYLVDTNMFVIRHPLSEAPSERKRLYKLDADSGDTWLVYSQPGDSATGDPGVQERAYVVDFFSLNIYGMVTDVMKIYYYSQPYGDTTLTGHRLQEDHFAVGIGLYNRYYAGYDTPSYILKGAILDGDTLGHITGLRREPLHGPVSLSLEQNYPNPFNPKTAIVFTLAAPGRIELGVYDTRGRRVALLARGRYAAGRYSYTFDGGYLASGTYIYYLKTAERTLTRKMLLLK